MATPKTAPADRGAGKQTLRQELTVVLVAAAIFVWATVPSPPHLMDDVDAVQAQIARTMLESGDWVTARLNGVAYLEKPPLKYWMIAVSFMIFGVHDWAARLPIGLAAVALAWLTVRFGRWAFGAQAGFYAGLALATCVGLFLFTRVLFPDVLLALAVTATLWGAARALEPDEPRPRRWAWLAAASTGAGILLKGLIAVVAPAGALLAYLLVTGRLLDREAWRRLHLGSGAAIALTIAAPWHVLATLRNPPYLDFALESRPGTYRGFFWFYFFNEHLLRFLGRRYPVDYNTVPRIRFWLLHLVWLFPWSVFFPAAARLSYRPVDRPGRVRLLALCWIGFLLIFFTFSTTQEYYTMPAYPALALLAGCAMAEGGAWVRRGLKAASVVAAAGAAATVLILLAVRGVPTPGDIADVLRKAPNVYEVYTLSLGHMQDLTLRSFAYLRGPLVLAGIGLAAGAVGAWWLRPRRAFFALALMMVVFGHAARLALIRFDPYLGSKPLADALLRAPQGRLIVDDQYYAFSSVFFYTNRRALLLNGRVTNLEYGSYAPDAPDVFIDDAEFRELWRRPERYYLVAGREAWTRLERLVGPAALYIVAQAGGKLLLTNRPL
ncbi:MAG TPA: glycosyltransferase family 39 protein [Bryobacteraceae bacterium]|nr:glycosyltransferase family 39 protein [Bryobacteraceae bacterium]